MFLAIKTRSVVAGGSLVEGPGAATVNDLVLRDAGLILAEEDIRKHQHSTSLQHHDVRNLFQFSVPQFMRCLLTLKRSV